MAWLWKFSSCPRPDSLLCENLSSWIKVKDERLAAGSSFWPSPRSNGRKERGKPCANEREENNFLRKYILPAVALAMRDPSVLYTARDGAWRCKKDKAPPSPPVIFYLNAPSPRRVARSWVTKSCIVLSIRDGKIAFESYEQFAIIDTILLDGRFNCLNLVGPFRQFFIFLVECIGRNKIKNIQR